MKNYTANNQKSADKPVRIRTFRIGALPDSNAYFVSESEAMVAINKLLKVHCGNK